MESVLQSCQSLVHVETVEIKELGRQVITESGREREERERRDVKSVGSKGSLEV